MSFADGWAALHLEMPPRIPHSEYSLELHPDVMERVTGVDILRASPDERLKAQQTLYDQWNYDLVWSILYSSDIFGEFRTRMGHAEYQAERADFDPVISSPFTSLEQVLAFDPFERFGSIPHRETVKSFERHYAHNCSLFPNQVNMTGIYVTCISGVLDLFGWSWLLLALGTDPAGFGKVVERYSSWIQQYFNALADSSVPVVMVHDDMVWTSGPFAKPSWYRAYVMPAIRRQLAPLRESGKLILFTSDGNYDEFVDDLADCGVNCFVLEPLTNMERIAEKYGRTHAFIGNADTRILLNGSREEIRAEVERCIRIGKNCPGYFMAVGNHIPPNTPAENVFYYKELYEKLSRR